MSDFNLHFLASRISIYIFTVRISIYIFTVPDFNLHFLSRILIYILSAVRRRNLQSGVEENLRDVPLFETEYEQ